MKTALDWFVDELQEHLIAYGVEIDFSKTEAFELAKEMEKEQIKQAFYADDDTNKSKYEDSEDYYNQTYNQNK